MAVPSAPEREVSSFGTKRKHHEYQSDATHTQRRTAKQAILQHQVSTLPISVQARTIKAGLRSRDVLLLVGETGSGKSTQVPQYLLNEQWCEKCIAITQPRRVAAISLARRVADEMGTTLGSSSPASKVGYSVRFDNNVAPATRIKYLTEGMLLQEMLRDPSLSQYSAVIVDEVHERSVNVDLILGFMKQLVRGGKQARDGKALKVVVMSATADINALSDFFAERSTPVTRTAPSSPEAADNESNASWSGISDEENEQRVSKQNGHTPAEVNDDSTYLCYIEGRQYPIQTTYISEATQDFTEAAVQMIFQIHLKEPLPGDILVFLPGQDTIEALESIVNEHASAMSPDLPKILALPLFAALPRAAQDLIFSPAPKFTRKVILSTNIAETSVTISGIRHVIDTGLAKVKEHRPTLSLDSLLVKPISKSSATQRKGRAGRDAPGKCYRLYTEQTYLGLEKVTQPEIVRCDLASAILTIKARHKNIDILSFPFLTPPSPQSLRKALMHLYRLGALDGEGAITDPIGLQMARLPLPPSLARILITAAHPSYDVLNDAIDIVAALTSETIFLPLSSDEKIEAATTARRELIKREGDHLTLLSTVQAYAAENADRKEWSKTHFISHRAMQNAMNVRKQLRSQCASLHISTAPAPAATQSSEQAQHLPRSTRLLRALLHSSPTNIARMTRDGSYRTIEGNQAVSIHPSSVLFGRKLEAVVYDELVFTGRGKTCMRGVSAVELGWLVEASGA
ncbi:MAG: putative ATP-dependent RNA helicase dhr2 [Chrysothrix sp. TS-e1954]|nr:MAG: putative ATP-dependent RNA helicase dhr2 [Chrysothrix sp. TS-e1954]